jgi:hypothetical protein
MDGSGAAYQRLIQRVAEGFPEVAMQVRDEVARGRATTMRSSREAVLELAGEPASGAIVFAEPDGTDEDVIDVAKEAAAVSELAETVRRLLSSVLDELGANS